MAENIRLSDIIPASPERVFTAWLDATEHARMTGATATDDGDGRFSAWDGYITGRTVSSQPHAKLVQTWRTTEFPPGAPDSKLTVRFAGVDGGTQVSVVHENLPDGQGAAYEQGWTEHYFTPMKHYFGSPLEQVREVSERITQAVDEVREEALEAVDKARGQARKQAVKAVQAVKKAQKKAARQLQVVGKRVKALVSKKKKPKARKKTKPTPKKKKAAPRRRR
jgi:uncharacterized protein YndB with AHSA1/START domain